MSFLQLIYSLWPLIFLAGWLAPVRRDLSWSGRLRLWIGRVLAAWLGWAFLGITLFINGSSSNLIPEPLNTLLFLGCGVILLVVWSVPVLWQSWQNRKLILQSRAIEDLYLLSPRQFENLIAAYFQQYGFKTERAGRSRDHGVDLIVYTQNGEKWVVQCKRWKASVGEPILRDLYGTMHHEGASRAFLMTTGSITPAAYSWALDKPIILYDGPGLIRLLHRVHRQMQKGRK